MSDLSTQYAPPRADTYEAPESLGEDVVDASQGTRLLNFFLDTIGRTVMAYGSMFLFMALGLEALGMVFMFLTLPGYYFVFEATLGRTPAKLITGTRVVATDGGPATTMQILGRSLARFVPFEPFSFLGSNAGWHDKWSGTRVVKG